MINQERRQVQKYKNLLSRTDSFTPLGIHQLQIQRYQDSIEMPPALPLPMFQCGKSQIYIPISQVKDGLIQCGSAEDEEPSAGRWKQAVIKEAKMKSREDESEEIATTTVSSLFDRESREIEKKTLVVEAVKDIKASNALKLSLNDFRYIPERKVFIAENVGERKENIEIYVKEEGNIPTLLKKAGILNNDNSSFGGGGDIMSLLLAAGISIAVFMNERVIYKEAKKKKDFTHKDYLMKRISDVYSNVKNLFKKRGGGRDKLDEEAEAGEEEDGDKKKTDVGIQKDVAKKNAIVQTARRLWSDHFGSLSSLDSDSDTDDSDYNPPPNTRSERDSNEMGDGDDDGVQANNSSRCDIM